MSMFELEHPLGKDLEKIHIAVSMGFIEHAEEQNPSIKFDYKDPLGTGLDVATIRVADWDNENMTAIYYPLNVDLSDPNWQILSEDGLYPVRQRIYTRDLLGRGFPLTFGEDRFVSTYLQFDVLDEAVALSGDDKGEKKVALGRYNGDAYDTMDLLARHQSSVRALLELAIAA